MGGAVKRDAYYLEEPTTGLYIVPGRAGNRLATRHDATRYVSAQAAALDASAHRVTEQAHEIVRVAA